MEFALPAKEVSALTKRMAGNMEMGEASSLGWQTLSTFAPGWWPQYHKLASVTFFVQHGSPSRQIHLATARKTDGEARVYLGWLEFQ